MKFGFAVAAALALSTGAQAAVVNLSGTADASLDGTNADVLTLAAGTYSLRFVEGDFTAFNRFSNSVGCNDQGFSCSQGFENSARYIINGETFTFGDRGAAGGLGAQGNTYYSTAAQSFAASQEYFATFTLTQTTDVSFFIFDDNLGDNTGGVSLSVNASPEPATWAMMVGGFGVVGAAARRRTRSQVTYA